MKGRRGVGIFTWIVLIMTVFSGCATRPEHFESSDDHRVMGLQETLKLIEKERLLFVGEALPIISGISYVGCVTSTILPAALVSMIS